MAQPDALWTVIDVSPTRAYDVSFVQRELGVFPYKFKVPVIANNLFPAWNGSITIPLSYFYPLIWIVNLWVNGYEAEPAVTEPALIQMLWAVILIFRSSIKITSPSIVNNGAIAGLTSITIVQLPFTVTF